MAMRVYKLLKLVERRTRQEVTEDNPHSVKLNLVGQYYLFDEEDDFHIHRYLALRDIRFDGLIQNENPIKNVSHIKQRGRRFVSVFTDNLQYSFYDTGLTLEEFNERKTRQ